MKATTMTLSTKPEQLLKKELSDFKALFQRLGGIQRTYAAKKAQQNVVKDAEKTCAVCGKKPNPPEINEPMGAHIVPHDEGGPPDPDNLICLCIRRWRALKPGVIPSQVGCHDLFDNYQVWTRQNMRELRKSIGTSVYQAKANEMLAKRLEWEKNMADQLQLALANRRWAQARRIVEERIEKHTIMKNGVEQPMTPNDEGHLRCDVLVATRKGYGRDRWNVIGKLLSKLTGQFNTTKPSRDLRFRADYEFGMLLFQLRRFDKSSKRLQASFSTEIPRLGLTRFGGHLDGGGAH